MGISELSYKDFTPVMGFKMDIGMLSVGKDSKYKNFNDLIEDARANPGKVKVGVGAKGSPWLMALNKIMDKEDIKFTVVVGSTGIAEVATNLIGGHIEAALHSTSDVTGLMKAGEIRSLALFGDERISTYSEVPTAKEAGFDIIQLALTGFLAPKDTPPEVVQKLHDMFKKVIESPEFNQYALDSGGDVMYLSSEDYAKFLEEEHEEFTELANKFGMKSN